MKIKIYNLFKKQNNFGKLPTLRALIKEKSERTVLSIVKSK
jgi:hypothetical protein